MGSPIKIEPRGKYAGVKIHLDGEEAQDLLNLVTVAPIAPSLILAVPAMNFSIKLGKKIRSLMEEVPYLLEDRTDDQIAEALERDKQKILLQQEAMMKGKDWKAVS